MQSTETRTKADIWLPRCRQLLDEWKPAPSKRRFVESVSSQMEENPDIFPTEAQETILGLIYWSLWKKNMSDVEREVMIQYGRFKA